VCNKYDKADIKLLYKASFAFLNKVLEVESTRPNEEFVSKSDEFQALDDILFVINGFNSTMEEG